MKLYFLLIPLAFLSCKATESSEISKKSNQKDLITSVQQHQPHNVEVSVKTFIPYCGGASPREDQLNNYAKGIDSYLLINTSINDTTIIESDSLGIIYLNLEIGNYEIRELYKHMSLDKFKAQNEPKANQVVLNSSEACYKKWWKENLLKFEIKDAIKTTKYDATINKMCFKGKNPCVMYNGQLPN